MICATSERLSSDFIIFFHSYICNLLKSDYLCTSIENKSRYKVTDSIKQNAKIAQLVEHDLAKVGVAGPSPVFRSANL